MTIVLTTCTVNQVVETAFYPCYVVCTGIALIGDKMPQNNTKINGHTPCAAGTCCSIDNPSCSKTKAGACFCPH